MNTEQNYSEGDNYANTPRQISGHQQIARLTPAQIFLTLKILYEEGKITRQQYQFGQLVPIVDESMAPQLHIGGAVVLGLIYDESAYWLRLGRVVALSLKNDPSDCHHIGRLARVDQSTVVLTQDNSAFGEMVFSRQQVDVMCDVVYRLNMPVL